MPRGPLDSYLVDAAEAGNVREVQKLLTDGEAVDQAIEFGGLTALFISCLNGHKEVVSALLAAGANTNHSVEAGSTPLISACFKGHLDIAAELLEAGADFDRAMEDGVTPMIAACMEGNLQLVQLLSSYGACRLVPIPQADESVQLLNAEDAAQFQCHESVSDWLVQSRGWTPLHHLDFLTPERTTKLLRAGARLDAVAADGSTPLSLASAQMKKSSLAADSAAALIIRSTESWSPSSHALFPDKAAQRAFELMCIGHQLSRLSQFSGEEQAITDVWFEFVLPAAVTRDSGNECPQEPPQEASQEAAGAALGGEAPHDYDEDDWDEDEINCRMEMLK